MTTQAPASTTSAAPRAYKILVAAAFEPTARAAMAEGMQLAIRSPGSELHVVHAFAQPSGLSGGDLAVSSEHLREATERLRMMIEFEWKQIGEREVIVHARPGDAAQVILQATVDIDADVVVVGSHRRTGISKLVLGSVAQQVLQEAHCPVLIAVPKDYSGTEATARMDPPCPDCLSTRKQTKNATFWCERHTKPYLAPHIYVPRDQARSSVFPTY